MAIAKQILKLKPEKELTFSGPFTQDVKTVLKLTNPSRRRVCFKIKTTASKRYTVRPTIGFIEPYCEVDVDIVRKPFFGSPNNPKRHKFCVLTLFVPDGFIFRDFDNYEENHKEKFMFSHLTVAFINPGQGQGASSQSRSKKIPSPSKSVSAATLPTLATADKKPRDNIPTCAICLETFKDPRVLPCGHSFCLECMKKIESVKPVSASINCPKRCATNVPWPQNGADGLPVNYDLKNVVEDTVSDHMAHDHMSCPAHFRPIQAYCIDCDKMLCIACLTSVHSRHKTKLVTESHEELNGRMQEITRKADKVTTSATAAVIRLEGEIAATRQKAVKLQQQVLRKEEDKNSLQVAAKKLDDLMRENNRLGAYGVTPSERWKLRKSFEMAVVSLESKVKSV